MEREIRERSRSRWRKFSRFLKLLIHPVKAFCLVLHLHLEVVKQNPGEKESSALLKILLLKKKRGGKGTFIKDKPSSLLSPVNAMIHEILSVSPGSLLECVSVRR